MDIIHQAAVILWQLSLHHHRFIPVAKHPAPRPTPHIKPPRIGVLQPFHPLHQVCLRRLDAQMVVIAHQHPRVHQPPRLGTCFSKTALNAVTCLCAAAFPNFSINSVCPGWVRTDMGGFNATRSPEEGADTIVWLATEAAANLSAKFLRDRKVIAW